MKYQYKREPLSIEETDRLINACKAFTETLIVVTLLDTGLRVGELCKLIKDNVLWQENRLIIYGKGGPYGKKSKRRVIPLTERTKHLLEAVFIIAGQNSLGLYPMMVQRILKRIADKAGITKKVTPHVLRHTYAVKCIRMGMPTRVVQELLGHDRLETTEAYLNISIDDVERVFKEKWR